MASTRNNNTRENYSIQTSVNKNSNIYRLNDNFSINNRTFLPDFGLNPAQLPRESQVMYNNSVDVESSLFGINATNLVNPREPIKGSNITRPVIRFYNKNALIMPKGLVMENDQRPLK
tara:strand:+ start:788 stop:1141 length:354 start_codon:yes stop_codon:yes gene_type:complete